jgi:hypothetical protein
VLKQGQRVRINKTARPQFRKSKRYREGTVLGRAKSQEGCVYVLWDRRRTTDVVSVNLLEIR